MIYLDATDLIHIAQRVLESKPMVRDVGLLESAAARARTEIYGADAYPDLETKAAALVQSVVSNHALIDGNKRLGLASLIAFLGVNGARLTWTNDEAYDFIIAIAAGSTTELEDIAAAIRAAIVSY